MLHSVQLERPQSFFSSQEDDRSKKLAAGKSNYSIRLSGSCLVPTELELLSFWKKHWIDSAFYRYLFYLIIHTQISVYPYFYFNYFLSQMNCTLKKEISFTSQTWWVWHIPYRLYTSEMQYIPYKLFSPFSSEWYKLVERNLQRENWTNSKQLW